MEGTNCELHPLIHTFLTRNLTQDVEKKKAEQVRLRAFFACEHCNCLVCMIEHVTKANLPTKTLSFGCMRYMYGRDNGSGRS